MFPLLIKQPKTKTDLQHLQHFILKQPQFYPRHETWVRQKCIPFLKQGEYTAFLMPSGDGKAIGDVVYTHVTKDQIKIKNFRIDPEYRNRDLGRFMLTQVYFETNKAEMVLDVTTDNFAGIEFFIRNGFHIIRKERLYIPTQDEYIMIRPS